MTNKERIIKHLNGDYTIGCWDDKIEQMSLYALRKFLKELHYESTDIIVTINRKVHVIEVNIMDKEIDFSVLTKAEYIDRYGDEKFEN